jgi:hypothetical protein
MQSVTGAAPPVETVARAMCDEFADVFRRTTATGSDDLVK